MSIRDTIAALLAKADSTTHPAEAETFIRKARKLMETHQVSMIEVEAGSDPIGFNDSNSFEKGTPASEKYDLEGYVAMYFGCRSVFINYGKRATLRVFGPESARETHAAMFPFIWKQVCSLARQHSTTEKERKALLRDTARALGSRLYWMKRDLDGRREKDVTKGDSTALVLVNLSAEVEAFVESTLGKPQPAADRNLKRPSNKARVLAKQVRVDQQLNSDQDGEATALLS